jgi:uncharacterized protein (TIGR03083 family)
MNLDEYLPVLDAEVTMFAAAAEEAGPAAAVPTCPGWTVRDLVLHLGEVHRWATAVVTSRATRLSQVPGDFLGELPAEAQLVDWFRAGAARLQQALTHADIGVDYATFLTDPPTPRLLFWARRQTMETGMHRVDAESALARRTPFAPPVALDGIDEFLTGFLPRSRTPLHSPARRTLAFCPDHSDRRWKVTISEDTPVTVRALPELADCTVGGSASDIHLALWTRGDLRPLRVDGDAAVFELVRRSVQVTWG